MAKDQRTDLAHLSSALAANNARVARFADGLTRRIDQLVEAALQEDWEEVRRVSDFLARSGDAHGYSELAQLAETVRDETQKPENQLAIKRSILRLIGTSSKAHSKRESARRTVS